MAALLQRPDQVPADEAAGPGDNNQIVLGHDNTSPKGALGLCRRCCRLAASCPSTQRPIWPNRGSSPRQRGAKLAEARMASNPWLAVTTAMPRGLYENVDIENAKEATLMHGSRRTFVDGALMLSMLSATASSASAQQLSSRPSAADQRAARSGGAARPTTRAELAALLQAAADTQTVALLDPATEVAVDRTIEVVQRLSTSKAWGVIGNGAKIRSTISNGTPVIKYVVAVSDPKNGTQSRGLTIQGLDITGSLKDGPGLMLHAPSGMGPIYRAILRDNTTTLSGGLGALHIKGAVFELLVAGHISENNKQNGVAIEHEGNAIVSNCMVHALNSSRNAKAGLFTQASSVDLVQGSFINNGECGINAPAGLRSAAFINGENTGQFVIRVGGYANLYCCEASTDGKTIQHDIETGQAVGRPTEALVFYAGFNQYADDLILGGACKLTGYNGGKGYLALVRQDSGTSTVWLEPWMDKSLVRRVRAADTLPAIRQVVAA
jgi:hypothetical protein